MAAHPTTITVTIATITWNQLTPVERKRIEQNRRTLARYVGRTIFEAARSAAARPAGRNHETKRAKCAK